MDGASNNKGCILVREMAQQLRVLAEFTEDPSLTHNTKVGRSQPLQVQQI